MKIQYLFLILLMFATVSCSSGIQTPEGAILYASSLLRNINPEVSEETVSKLVDSNTQFAIDLYQQLIADSDDNLVISPYSISQVWAMVWEGADGESAVEIANVLHFDGFESLDVHRAFNKLNLELENLDKQKEIEWELTNSIWASINENWRQEYLDTIKTNYDSGIFGVDFENDTEGSRKLINKWIKEKTKGHFSEAIDSDILSPVTVMVLINALYFNGLWESPFDPEATRDGVFNLLDGNIVIVPTMYQLQTSCGYIQDEKHTAIELRYRGNAVSMLIIMPHEGEFNNFEAALSLEILDDISNSLLYDIEQELYLPKFELTNKDGLKDGFKNLGIVTAFEGSDFSRMLPDGGLWVNEFIHGAYIKVNEVGTEAAAFSAADIMTFKMEPIRINHPFLFLIRDNKTKSILFLGRVVAPSIL